MFFLLPPLPLDLLNPPPPLRGGRIIMPDSPVGRTISWMQPGRGEGYHGSVSETLILYIFAIFAPAYLTEPYRYPLVLIRCLEAYHRAC